MHDISNFLQDQFVTFMTCCMQIWLIGFKENETNWL